MLPGMHFHLGITHSEETTDLLLLGVALLGTQQNDTAHETERIVHCQ